MDMKLALVAGMVSLGFLGVALGVLLGWGLPEPLASPLPEIMEVAGGVAILAGLVLAWLRWTEAERALLSRQAWPHLE